MVGSITPFDLAGSAAKGQALGQQDRLRESNNALSDLLQQTPPTTPANRAQLQGQAFTSGINPQQSFQLVQSLSQMDANERATLKDQTARAARLAFTIKNLPPEQRANAFQAARKQMPTVFDQNVTDQESLDFALDSTINEGIELSELFKQSEQFTPVRDANGNIIGQQSSRTNRVVEDPRAVAPAEPPKLSDAAGLRKEFTNESKNFVLAQDGLLKVRRAAKGNSAQNDVALIFGFMKVVDPGSTVREGEFATAENTEGVTGRVRNLYNRLRTGERLNAEQRKGFVDAAEKQFIPLRRAQEKRVGFFRDVALRNRFNPKDIVRDLKLSDLEAEPAPAPAAAPVAEAAAPATLPEGTVASTPDGSQSVIVKNGQWVPLDGQ